MAEKSPNPKLKSCCVERESNVILDPDTAHPCLLVSEDGKSVRMGDRVQDLPANPERFDLYPFVLGCEGFKAGRHFWEVTLGHREIWVVGVLSESVSRKDVVNFLPEEGIWGLGKWDDEYRASTRHWEPPLALLQEPTKVRVMLNYEGGQVAFFDADTLDMLYVYSDIFFSGETILPFLFLIGEEPMMLSP
ncbi:thaicobrin-like [Elgaria multicarinata webbii]|uniref:thaicobrin-like n=1 Tax=Elgaria multicarinata webbii TaxID=159646 RepID=UPI002FCD338F